jgi:hypothetical protein
MIVILYILSFGIMFPYFELFKNAVKDHDIGIDGMLFRHWLFFFIFLPIQFAISVHLTYFETKKMILTKDKLQIPVIIYNGWQVIMPLFDMIEYMNISPSPTFDAIWRALQYGLNANFIIFGLIVLLYKIKYLNIANFYIARFFMVL